MKTKLNILNILAYIVVLLIGAIYIYYKRDIDELDKLIFDVFIFISLLMYPLVYIIFLTIKEGALKIGGNHELDIKLVIAYIILGGGLLQVSYYIEFENVGHYYFMSLLIVFIVTYILWILNKRKTDRKK